MYVLVATSKGMRAVKVHCSKILHFLTGGAVKWLLHVAIITAAKKVIFSFQFVCLPTGLLLKVVDEFLNV